MDPLRSILRNWTLLAGGQVVSSLLSMVLMVIVSRSLGESVFGRITLALALATLVGIAIDFGLSQVVTRVVARDRSATRAYVRRAMAVLAVMGLVLYGALLAVTRVLGYGGDVLTLAAIFGVLMISEGASQLLAAVFQAHERMVVPALARMAANAVALALVVVVLRAGHGASAVAIALVAGAFVRLAIQMLALGTLDGFQRIATSTPPVRAVLRAGLPFLAAQALAMFVLRINVVMLGRMASEATVGWYGVASRLVEALNFIPLVMTAATFPVLSRLWAADRVEFAATARKTLQLIVAIAFPVSALLFVLADDVIATLFRLEGYGPAVPLLRIHAISLGLVFVDYLFVCTVMASGRERIWIAIVAAACILNPVLNWALIPPTEVRFANGAIGAAIATLITEIFFCLTALRASPAATFDRASLTHAARAGSVAAGLGVAVAALRVVGVPWMLAATLGGCAYALCAFRLGIVPPDVASWIGATLRRRSTVSPALAVDVAATGVDAA